MSAAVAAADGGLRVLLLDEQPQPGGQIYRNVGAGCAAPKWLGKDYAAGSQLVDALARSGVTVQSGAAVWRVDGGPRVVWSQNGLSRVTTAPYVLLASGAQERPVPFPGWTLPGVMTAGAAQILMKTAGMLPKDAVLAGSGPLLYLVAAQMIDAGCPPKALVETQTHGMLLRALPHLPKALFSPDMLMKGLGLIGKIRAAGVPRYKGASGFAATGDGSGMVNFSFRCKGKLQNLKCTLLLTHQGVTPSTHMSRAAGIKHEWNAAQHAFQPICDIWGATDRPGLYVAGDGAVINGASAASATGKLAALDILRASGRISADARNQRATTSLSALFRARAIRPFLDAAYQPPAEILSPPDQTIVCRCEEVTARAIRQGISEGANGHRQIKTSLRAGMGPCQGRMCDATVRGILSAGKASRMGGIDPPRARAPIKPITLGELAALSPQSEDTA